MSEPPESMLPPAPPAGAPVLPTPRRAGRTDLGPRIGSTDGELLGVFVRRGAGDTEGRAALDRLVDRHAAMVWRVCRQALRRPADAEDAFQATFLILARSARSIRSSDSAAGWLYRVAHRTALAARRKAKLRKETPLDTEPLAPAEEPFPDLVGRQSVTLLMDELNRLPEKYRTPLVLRYLEGQSRRSIADATDTTIASVQGRLARGKQLLRSRLVRRGVSLSTAMAVASGGATRAEAAPARLVATATTNCQAIAHGGAAVAASATALTLYQEGARAMFYATMAKPAGVAAGVLMAALLAIAPTGLAGDPAAGLTAGPLVIDATVAVADVSVDGAADAQPSAELRVAAQPDTIATETPNTTFVPSPPVSAATAPAGPVWSGPDAAANAPVRRKLKEPLTDAGFDFSGTPLEAVTGFLADEYGLAVHLDRVALDQYGLGADEPVTAALGGVAIGVAIDLALEPLECCAVPYKGTLMITTKERAAGLLETAVYPVADLIEHDGMKESLIDAIEGAVRSSTWAVNGGGEAEVFLLPSGQLVVSQTEGAHAEIAALLASLRETNHPSPPAAPSLGIKRQAAQAAAQAEAAADQVRRQAEQDKDQVEASKRQLEGAKRQLQQRKAQLLEAIAEIEQLTSEAVRGVPPESVEANRMQLYDAVEQLEQKISELIANDAMAGGEAVMNDPFSPRKEPQAYGLGSWTVEKLQRLLNESLDPSPGLDVDGDYGPLTGKAVARFQEQEGLPPTGSTHDPATRRALTRRALGYDPPIDEATYATKFWLLNRAPTPVAPPASAASPPTGLGEFINETVESVIAVAHEPPSPSSPPSPPSPPNVTAPLPPQPPKNLIEPPPTATAWSPAISSTAFSSPNETEQLLKEIQRLLKEIQDLVHRSKGQAEVANRLARQIVKARQAEGAAGPTEDGPVTRAAMAALENCSGHNRYLQKEVESRAGRLIELSVYLWKGDHRSTDLIDQLAAFGEQLKAAQVQINIAFVQANNAGPESAVSETTWSLALGAKDGLVPELQRQLNARLDPSPGLEADGDFGPLTEQTLRRFQRENGLTPSGVADEATWERLGGESDEPTAPQATEADEKVKADATVLPEPIPDSPYARIVSSAPARGAADVGPGLAEVRVTFDRDMQGGMSWTGNADSGMPPTPDGQKPHWVDKRTCVLPVRLSGGELYRVGVNSKSNQNFKSEDGKPAAHDVLTFATSGAKRSVVRKAQPPRVKEVSPAHDAAGVDPGTRAIRVTFDTPMAGGMSWVKSAGGAFPGAEGQPAKWSRDGRTCTLPVDLRPGVDYAVSLNGPFFLNFASKWGVPLEPVEWRFTTSDAADAGAVVDEPSREEVADSMNRLKDLMLGMLNHQSATRRFPARAVYGERERPLLSWRVALLPYLGERELYDEFRLDEPWDSPHNEKLIGRMPDAFRSPRAAAGTTRYQAVWGPRAFMPDRPLGRQLREFVDGTSGTIALVETAPSRAVAWTQPSDYRPDEDQTAPLGWPAGTAHDRFLVALVDGSIKQLPAGELRTALPGMLVIDDRQKAAGYGGGFGATAGGFGGGYGGEFGGGFGRTAEGFGGGEFAAPAGGRRVSEEAVSGRR